MTNSHSHFERVLSLGLWLLSQWTRQFTYHSPYVQPHAGVLQMHFVTRAEMQADHTLLEYKRHCIVLALPCSIGFYPPTRGDFVVNKVDFEQLVTLSSTSAEMLTSNQDHFHLSTCVKDSSPNVEVEAAG